MNVLELVFSGQDCGEMKVVLCCTILSLIKRVNVVMRIGHYRHKLKIIGKK